MKEGTTIQERLWDLRKEKGLNLEELAVATGLSKSALGSYEKDELKEISHKSLVELAKFYGVSVDYILCLTENRNPPNTELTELHLSDDMVELLKSGRINNRLLCEQHRQRHLRRKTSLLQLCCRERVLSHRDNNWQEPCLCLNY